MKPEYVDIPNGKPAVATHNGHLLAIVGGTRRRTPFEIRWWAFDLMGDIVVLERQWNRYVNVTSAELHRPCHEQIVLQVMKYRWQAAFELGRYYNQEVLEMNARSGLFAF